VRCKGEENDQTVMKATAKEENWEIEKEGEGKKVE